MFKRLLSNVVLIIFISGCLSRTFDFPEKSFRSRLTEGDSHIGWSLNYFGSWQKGLQPRYLILAESHTISAIQLFSQLESDTSPRISEYYVVRERRTRGCRLLAEIQFAAINHGHQFSKSTPEGCIYF